MRTLSGYGIAVVVVLVLLNLGFWWTGSPRVHDVRIFSIGFALGMFGMYLAARLYGYHQG
jgi:hypothetical protein